VFQLTTAQGQTNWVFNGDFEQGAIPSDRGQINLATGWRNSNGVGTLPTPDLMDARSGNPLVGVPSNHWHTSLLDLNSTQGKQRYAFVSNSVSNGTVTAAEYITGSLLSKLPQGCYSFQMAAARPNQGGVVIQYPNQNFLRVLLKSSISGVPPKVIHDLSGGGSTNAIQQFTWTTRGSTFTISAAEANLYDSIIVALNESGTARNNHALVDEIVIRSQLELGTNLPDVVRVCLGTELSLTPNITYNGLLSTNPSFLWSKSPGAFNHIAAQGPQIAPYTLLDYPLENSTYTFSGTDNGCFASKTVQVIVGDLEPASLNGSFTECDLDGVQSYSLNNNVEGVEVSWSVVGGSLQLPPVMNPTFADITWTAAPGAPKYVIVTQNSWTCSRTDTFFVYGCCQRDMYDPADPNPNPELVFIRAINTSHSNLFSSATVNNTDVQNIEINGEYKIDEAVAIYNDIHFYLGPGAKITVEGALVEFNRCTFQACGGEMWDGIYANERQIDMNDCAVKESKTGISLRNRALLRANNTVFTKNYISIQGNNLVPVGTSSPSTQSYIQLTNCTLRGNESGSLLAPYNQTVTTGGVTTFRNSHAAIVLHNAMGIRIGDPVNSNNVNYFEGLNNGILARFAQVDVAHAVFSNIATNELHPQALYPLLNGAAIRYNNLNTPYFNRNEQSKILFCTFNSCQFGVEGFFNDSMRVENSTFNFVKQGVKFVNPMGRISIMNNYIENDGIGVGIVAQSTFSSPQYVLGVNYVRIGNNVIKTRNVGIDVIGLRTFIGQNDISLDYHTPGATFTGIRVRNLDASVGDPTIQQGSDITLNHIKVINGLPSQQDVENYTNMLRWNRGIAAEHCGYLTISSNLIENTVSAMVLEGDLFANVEIRCNTMADNYIGLNRLNNTITQQGGPGDPADNKWIRIKGVSARVWDPSFTSFALKYFHRGQTFGWNNVYSPAPFSSLVNHFENENSSKDCEFLRPDGDEGGEENYVDLPQLEEVASGSVNFASLATDVKSYQEYYAAYKVIEAVKADSSLLSSSTLSTFYSQNQTELRNYLGDAHEALLAGDLTAYAQHVSTTTGAHVFDSLERVVAAIYARSWALPAEQPLAFDSADHATLYQIAHLDVLAGGEAVFTARVMLGIDPQPQMNLRQRDQNELRFVNDENVVVFPNPAQNDLRISLSDINEATYTYRILDINGRLMAEGSVQYQDGYGFIDLTTLSNGVYVLQMDSEFKSQRTKLVVMKP